MQTTDELDLFKDVLTGAVYDESAWSSIEHQFVEYGPEVSWRWRLRGWLLLRLARFFSRRGIQMVQRRPYSPEARLRGDDWPFVGYTMIGRQRLDQLQASVDAVLSEGIAGDLLEAGVWRGGACMLMKRQLRLADDRTRRIWLADSFAGLPPPENRDDGWDLSSNGYLAVSAEQVRRNFERFGLWDERVCLLEGWFKDTLPRAPVERLAILRLDGDLYHSTRDILENLYPRVSPGGFIIVDDYGSWPGCRRAVTEYLTKIGESPEITPIDDTGVFWRRPV